jgi:hypothetical protein
MNKSLAVTAAALVVALIGLVYYAFVAPRSPTSNDHFIKVWVQTDAGKPTIHVSVPELHKHGQNQNIFWDIDNTGTPPYKFPETGIVFMANGTAVFECGKQNDTKFKCKDPTGALGKYKYTVTVVGMPQPDPLPVNPLDPWIYNE